MPRKSPKRRRPAAPSPPSGSTRAAQASPPQTRAVVRDLPSRRELRSAAGLMARFLASGQRVGGGSEKIPYPQRVRELRTATNTLVERLQWMRQAGITFHGARDLYEVLGYSRQLTGRMYRDRYARGGIAGRVVEALPHATWRGDLQIVETADAGTPSTPFEKAWAGLELRLQLKAVLQRVDILSMLGSYAVLFLGAPGSPSDALTVQSPVAPDNLWYATPFSGGGGPGMGVGAARQTGDIDADATITAFEQDPKSPRFGQPLTYALRRLDIQAPELRLPIHWSRILHVAEGILDNEVYGQPALERCWNLLDDLDKVTGGGAEAFWLRANQGMHLDVDPTMTIEEPERKRLKEHAQDYKHELTRMLVTRGVDAKVLGSDVANFGPPSDAILKQIAGSKSIPLRILTGSEMGELASSQDRDNWKDQVNGRQTGYAGPYIVRPLIDRLVAYGFLPSPSGGPLVYIVRWPHIQTLTEAEKFAGAQAWANINKAAGVTVFTADEIRDKWYSMSAAVESDQEQYKAEIALKMATVNKTQGVTIFTSAEIRKISYGFAPLAPDEEVPIGAPERISVTTPPPEPGVDGNEPAPGTAEDAATAAKVPAGGTAV